MPVWCLAVTSDVSQQCVAGQPFTVTDLHQFVDQANREGLIDDTRLLCTARPDSSVFSLQTFAARSEVRDHSHVTPKPGENVDPTGRTTIAQSSTGPIVSRRRWFRTYSANALLLGDARALLARIYEARVPWEHYEITALPVSKSVRQLVFSIDARPRDEFVIPQETGHA